MPSLILTETDSVKLTASIDSTGALQLAHSSQPLAGYDDSVLASYGETGRVTFYLIDFEHDHAQWTMTASHAASDWRRDTTHASHTFEQTTDFIEVSVTTTNQTASKTKLIKVKTQPEGSLPGDPDMFGAQR